MAFLINKQDGKPCYLKAHHVFGRLPQSATSVIAKPEVSKIHAIIQWNKNAWYLIDYSSNGTWLNSNKVTKSIETPIKLDDVIGFASKGANEFIVKDLSPPCDLLVPYGNTNSQQAIELKPYNLLPNDESPEISLIYEDTLNCWFVERLQDENKDQEALSQDQLVTIDGQQWQLNINVSYPETINLTPRIASLNELNFIFNVSADEEVTQLILQTADQSIDLMVRSHHYLTLLLARKRVEDIKNAVAETEQGWMYSDQLSKDLGLELCHLNIQVHRARKQFSDNINNSHLGQLFERQSGRIRLGSRFIIINKSGRTEYSYLENKVEI